MRPAVVDDSIRNVVLKLNMARTLDQGATAVARGGARALVLAVGGSLCACDEGGRGAAGLGRTRTTR